MSELYYARLDLLTCNKMLELEREEVRKLKESLALALSAMRKHVKEHKNKDTEIEKAYDILLTSLL